MSIDPARGLYHCFGCGKGGDLFQFIQETQTLDFSDAVELLARRSGVTLHRDPDAEKRRDRRQALVDATALAVEFYNEQLKSGSEAGAARAYLRGRGYGSEVVEQFQIGFSPPGGELLVDRLRRAKVPEEVAVTAGLALRARTGRVFDRFRGRVMFPIFDVRNDPVGFGARVLEGDGPKYLNSPETPIYHKSRLLYGLNWAKSDIVRDQTAVVVEGYTDVIALHLAGKPLAVATCGTALGEEHLDLLRRFSERVVLMFDADEAGAAASVRGFARNVPVELDVRVAAVPVGQDPADLVAAGRIDELVEAIESAEPIIRFLLDQAFAGFDWGEPESRERAVNIGAPLIALYPGAVARASYARDLAYRAGIDVDPVIRAVEQELRAQSSAVPSSGEEAQREPLTGPQKAERELLRLLLANDPAVRRLPVVDLFTLAEHQEAYALIAPVVGVLPPGDPPDLGALLSSDESEIAGMLRRLAFEERPLPEANEVVDKVQLAALDRRIFALSRQVQATEADSEEYSSTYAELIALQRERRERQEP